MFDLEKKIIESILDSLSSYKTIADDIANSMTYEENKKYFQGKGDGILEAATLIKRQFSQFELI